MGSYTVRTTARVRAGSATVTRGIGRFGLAMGAKYPSTQRSSCAESKLPDTTRIAFDAACRSSRLPIPGRAYGWTLYDACG